MSQSQVLKKIRLQLNLTQNEFAEIVGVDRTRVVKYETEKHKITLEMFLSWCEKLNINPKDVFDI